MPTTLTRCGTGSIGRHTGEAEQKLGRPINALFKQGQWDNLPLMLDSTT
jgi:hypothetical protein